MDKVVPCVGEGGTDRCLNFLSDEGLIIFKNKKR